MRFRAAPGVISPFLLVCIALILVGCAGDHNPVTPTQPDGAAGQTDALWPGFGPFPMQDVLRGSRISLADLWPNNDGRYWIYRITERIWDFPVPRYYPVAWAVPPAPSLREVAALLRYHPIGENPVLSTAGYLMRFNGTKTTLSGAVGQNLETTIQETPVSVAPAALAGAATPPGFLKALARARPDLIGKFPANMRLLATTAPASAAAVDPPMFLFGYAWVKTRQYIGSYGDLSTELAWKYLVSNLKPGSGFSMQLVPELADDVFLRAVVLPGGNSIADVGSVRRVVTVLYVIDFGVSAATDVDGNPLGYSRLYSYGTIDYEPKVGPVASYERALVQAGSPLDTGILDETIDFVATGNGEVGIGPAAAGPPAQ